MTAGDSWPKRRAERAWPPRSSQRRRALKEGREGELMKVRSPLQRGVVSEVLRALLTMI